MSKHRAKRPTVADVVHGAIARAYERLLAHEAALVNGDNVEDVHQARVATRRLRSDLRTFEPWLDEDWCENLRAELRWLGAELGAVRDLDVMRARLRDHADRLPTAEADAAERVVRRLDADRAAAQSALVDALHSTRYAELRTELATASHAPRTTKHARTSARKALPPALRKRWRQLRKEVGDLGDRPSDEGLHAVRIRAKRARYAAEAAEPVFGKPARRYAKAMAAVQEVLGDHHDGVVASAWLAKTAHECSPAEAYAVGMLAQIERAEADHARAAFDAAWQRASSKRLRAWM
jgi:CHAD domain-containing protein